MRKRLFPLPELAGLFLISALVTGLGGFRTPRPIPASAASEPGGESHAHEEHGHEGEDTQLAPKHEEHTHESEGSEIHEAAEAGYEDHAHHEENIIALDERQKDQIGLRVEAAAPGSLDGHRTFPGEIVLNEDRVAHIVPRAAGIVRAVEKSVGETVDAGEIMAWIDSVELGEAKVDYLTQLSELGCCTIDLTRADEVHDNTVKFIEVLEKEPSLEELRETNSTSMGENRAKLVAAYAEYVYARSAYEREKQLQERGIGRKEDYLAAESALKKGEATYTATIDSVGFQIQRDLLEARQERRVMEIALEGAERRLHVLGLSEEEVAELGALAQAAPSSASGHAEECSDPNCAECRAKNANVPTLEIPKTKSGRHDDRHEGECTDPNCATCATEGHTTAADAAALTEQRGGPDRGNAHLVLGRYPLRAPFAGTVIDKHITLGEKLDDDAVAFTIADLGTVWADIRVYQKDLAFVHEGQAAVIEAGAGGVRTGGTISFVSPLVDHQTRTALARVVVDNSDGLWRPGMFVNARTTSGGADAPVVVPKEAVQMMGEETVVFIETDHGFEPRAVVPGESDASRVEIVSGLAPGERYAARGAFELKAMLVVSGLGSHAGHGH